MTATKKTGRVVFMHTIDGKPAQYYEGEQICFSDYRIVDRFALSAHQIRNEFVASENWKARHGFSLASPGEYGSVCVRLPADD